MEHPRFAVPVQEVLLSGLSRGRGSRAGPSAGGVPQIRNVRDSA
jgi:hypothetical protein